MSEASKKPVDISAALAAMEQIEKLPPMRCIPPWLCLDRDERPEPEGDSHVILQLGGRCWESDGSGSMHRVR